MIWKKWSLNKKINILAGVTVLFISLLVYLRSVAPTTSFWDCGEFIACSRILGVMHPPGAPLYLLIGRIMTMLPFSADIGYRVNLFSVFISSVTVLLMYMIIVQLIQRWRGKAKTWEDRIVIYLSAVFGSLSFAFTDSFWFNAVEAEVYGFSMFFTALVIWLALFWEERSEKSGSILIILFVFYLFGLAIGVHLLNILAFPFVLMIAFFHDNKTVRRLLILLTLQAGIPIFLYILFYQFDPSQINSYNAMIAHQDKAGVFLKWFGLIWILVTLIYVYNKDKKVFKIWWIIPLLVIIGYSLYLLIFIRAGLNPPINENSPTTLQGMSDYLTRKQYGQESMLLTFLHRKAEFWSYQINMMFNRYFAWQFIGKGTTLDYHNRIVEIISFKGLFGLPFLVGLWGTIHHFFKDKKRAFAILGLFFLMGYAIILYLNQPDPQPRERDYSYVGAFFAFALWIGIGFAGFFEMIENSIKHNRIQLKKIVYIAVSILLFIAVPLNLYAFNHHSHSRHGNFVAWDYSHNLLETCEPNSIVFTNGDNDTFPLWYLQEVEGVRKDVKVVNLSLLNTPWYIKQLRDEKPKIPLKLSNDIIDNLTYLPWESQQFAISIPDDIRMDELKILKKNNKLIKLKDIPEKMIFNLSPTHPPERPQVLRVQDLMVLRILEKVKWKRPVYFAVTVAAENLLGMHRFLRMDGLAYKIVPFVRRHKIRTNILGKNMFEKFQYRNLNNPDVYYNVDTINLLQNYRSAFIQLTNGYLSNGEEDKASKTLDEMSERIPAEIIPYTHQMFAVRVADLYDRLGRSPEAKKQESYLRGDLTISSYEKVIIKSRSALEVNDWKRAETILKKYLESNANDPRVSAELLKVYELSNQYQKGIELLKQWLKYNPNDKSAKKKMKSLEKMLSEN